MRKYNDENISSNLLDDLVLQPLNELKSPDNPLSKSKKLCENSSLLLDTPVSSKATPQPCIYTNDNSSPVPGIKVGESYKTPSKLVQEVSGRSNKRKGGEEDIVNFEQSSIDHNTSSYTPKQLTKEMRESSHLKRSSTKRSPSENRTPNTKLALLRQERQEERRSQKEDIKLEEMQKELELIPKLSEESSLHKSNSIERLQEDIKARTQEIHDFTTEIKCNGSRAISPLAGKKSEANSVMEKKCEEESEQTKAKITETEAGLTLDQRMIKQIWQVRRNAYAELGKKFSKESDKEMEDPFYKYSSWLRYMLKDGNLIALQEGLNTILIYSQNSPTLGPAIGLVPDLLDKVPLQRVQFQELVSKILFELVKRNQGQYVVSELVSRLNSKKVLRCTQFALNCLSSMLESNLYKHLDLKYIYKAAGVALTSQKEARAQVIKLLERIYSLVEDKIEGYTRNLPEYTKPLAARELGEALKGVMKRDIPDRILMFPEELNKSLRMEVKRSSSVITRQREHLEEHKKSELKNNIEVINLFDCIDENVLKLAYITKAEEKKEIMENFNLKLQSILHKAVKLEKKDYSKLINILCTLLEDNNTFLEIEVLKALQPLGILLNKDIQNYRPKQIIGKLLDRLKENRTAVSTQIEATITEFVVNGCIVPEALIDTVMQKVTNSKHPRVRQMALQLLANQKISFAHSFGGIIGPKLLSVIKKDPIAGVRDAAIVLLTQIKLQCPDNADVEKLITKLPKARIQEINAQVEILKEKNSFTLLKRSKSDFKGSYSKEQEDKVEVDEKQVETQDIEEAICTPDESVRRLLQIADTSTYEEFLLQLRKIPSHIQLMHRSHILYGLSYFLTYKYGSLFNLTENYALALSNIVCPLLEKGELIEQEIDCALSIGINVAAILNLINHPRKYIILQLTYHSSDIDSFVSSLQRVLNTFKCSEENDSSMTVGVTAYKTIADWLLADFREFKENIEKLANILGISNTTGFKKDFIAQMEKTRQQLVQKGKKLVDQKELNEIITSTSAMIMNLKAPTPRSKTSQLKEIITAVNHKDIFKNKKSLESLNGLLEECLNSNKKLPASLLKELVEGICKLIAKVQWMEDDVLKLLLELRPVVDSEDTGKMLGVILKSLLDFIPPEHPNGKHLEYYKVLNAWCKQLSKKEISEELAEVFNSEVNDRNHFKLLLHWFSTQILGNFFSYSDMEPLLPFVIKGLKAEEGLKKICEKLLRQCYEVFGIKKAQYWLEETLAQSQALYKIYGEWHDNYFNNKQSLSKAEAKVSKEEFKVTKESVVDKFNEVKSNEVAMNEINSEVMNKVHSETEGHRSVLSHMLEQLDNLSATHAKQISLEKTPKDIKEERKSTPNKDEQKTCTLPNSKTPDNNPQRETFTSNKYRKNITSLKIDTENPIEDKTPSPRFGSEIGTNNIPLSMKELNEDYIAFDKLDVFKFQCILLDIKPCKALSNSLVNYFKQSTEPDKCIEFTKKFNTVLANEDLTQCIPEHNLHALLDSCIKMCAIEKTRIMSTGTIGEMFCAYNNVVIEFQNSLNQIVNSLNFTQSISMFISLIKENLPEDFAVELSKETVIYLKMIVICLKKILKAAQPTVDNNIPAFRAFNLLLELYKLFTAHPPEKLKQDLPSLVVLDQVYRALREVANLIVETDLEKSANFVSWTEANAMTGSFLKYIKNIIGKAIKRRNEMKIIN